MKINTKTLRIFLILLVVIFAGIVLAFLVVRDRVGPGMVRPEPSVEMKEKTVQAEIKAITEWYEAVGTVRPGMETRIEAQLSAQVVDVLVRAGDMVEKDQVLVVLDQRQMDTRLSQARQALKTAISYKGQEHQSLNAAQAAFNEAEADHKRIKNYFESQAATKQELERAESRFLQAVAGLKRAREAMEGAVAGIRQAEEMVREAEIFIDYTRVMAPAEGTVLERLIEPGDMALPGKTLILLKTSNALRLEAFVREGLIRNVEPGATLSAVITTLDQTVAARVDEIIPYADPKTRTFLVKATLPIRVRKLIPLQLARIVRQRIRHRMWHSRRPVPDAAELVLMQLTGRVQVGVHRPAAGGQIELLDLGGPRVVVEVRADLDDVVAQEIGDFFAVRQPVVVPNLVIDHRDRVKIERHVVRFLMAHRRQRSLAPAGGDTVRPKVHEQMRSLLWQATPEGFTTKTQRAQRAAGSEKRLSGFSDHSLLCGLRAFVVNPSGVRHHSTCSSIRRISWAASIIAR